MIERLGHAPPKGREQTREGWQEGHGEHPLDRFLKKGRIPHIWCPGCGVGIAFTAFVKALEKGAFDLDRTVVVSGIGCSGRAAGYLNLDTYHTTHGRAIPFATGLKLAEPRAQGGGLQRRRRPFRHRGESHHPRGPPERGHHGDLRQQLQLRDDGRAGRTHDSPRGEDHHHPLRVRRAPLQPDLPGQGRGGRLRRALDRASHLRDAGHDDRGRETSRASASSRSSLPCPTGYARRNRLGEPLDLMRFYKENSFVSTELDPENTALPFKGKVAVGKFVDIQKPTFMEMYESCVVARAKGKG